MKKKKKILILSSLLFSAGISGLSLLHSQPAQLEGETRTIRLLQDDAQLRLASKVYELRHVRPTDIRPYVEAAVTRYWAASKTERVTYASAGRHLLIVSTGEKFLPYVDELIERIDRPGKADEFGSIIEGTGITRIAYTPNYRAAEDIVRVINGAIRSSEGMAYLNKETNTIYWKDDKALALDTLAWVKRLDRPLPQVNLRLNYYEVRESSLRDLGVDYLAWRNGPGMSLFETAYSNGGIASNEALPSLAGGFVEFVDAVKDFSVSWRHGGFFAAPQFDTSFLRLLQQSGKAKLLSSADLTFLNTPIYDDPSMNQYRDYRVALTPEYRNIRKGDDDDSEVVTSSSPSLELRVFNPVICFGTRPGQVDAIGNIPADEAFHTDNEGGVTFEYHLLVRDVVERNNRGDELGNSTRVSGSLTLGFKTEKLLSSHIREIDVEETSGIPYLVRIPLLKYLVGSSSTLKEKTSLFVTAEAVLLHPETLPPAHASRALINEELNKTKENTP